MVLLLECNQKILLSEVRCLWPVLQQMKGFNEVQVVLTDRVWLKNALWLKFRVQNVILLGGRQLAECLI